MYRLELATFLDERMENYFYKKIPSESSDSIKTKITELLKYLFLTEYHRGNVPFTKEIDDIWHLWIMQTRQYQDLMGKLPTKKFIHHSSNDYVDLTRPEEPKDIKVQRQMSYLASYVFNFGPLTKEVVNYYPTALLYMSVKNMKLAELNEYLLNFSKISA